MPNKPDFIVDPSGRVRDVRAEKYAPNPPSSPPPTTPGTGTGSSISGGNRGLSPSPQRTPGGFIIIPIGLILSLILGLCRMVATQGSTQKNSYSESEVNTLDMGLYYYDQGDYEKAILHFNMALATEPNMGEAYNDRGLAYYAIGENEKAIADFDKAIELMPDPAVSYSNRGGVYLSLGNHDQALADLDEAIKLSPHLAKAYHNRGLTYLDLGDYDKAIADFDKAIEFTSEQVFSMRATMESKAPTSESLFGGNVFAGLMNRQTDADLPKTYASRAMAYVQKGDYESATADLAKAKALGFDPGFALGIEEQIPVTVVTPQSGHWEGMSTHAGYSGTVSFDIGADGQIHEFMLDLFFSDNNSCQAAANNVYLQPDGTFSFTFDTPGMEGVNLIEGKFESTAVSGSFSRHIVCVSTTGEHIDGYLSQGASWSAQWISNPEPISNGSNITGQAGNETEGVNVSALAIDPANPTILYAGTSRGVYKSTDHGAQWSAVNNALTASYVSVLAIDPSTPETLYAGTSEGLFKSMDGAANWTSITSGSLYPHISALVIDPVTPTTIYVGTLMGVYKSTDGGASWMDANIGLGLSFVNALAINPATPDTLFAGTSDGVFKSMDGGQSWYAANTGLPYGYVQVLAIDPAAPDTVYAGTGEGLFKSTDGGINWSKSFWALPIITFAIDPNMPSTIYVGRSDGLHTSADGGANWAVIYGNQAEIYVNVVAVDPLASGALYAATSNGMFRITDGGINWEALSNGLTN